MDEKVQAYIDGISDDFRPLFDRLHGLILKSFPDAKVTISYRMPSYKVGKRRLYLAAFKDHVGIYGWQDDRDAGFVERHPKLRTGKGTIQLTNAAAKKLSNKELTAFISAEL